MTPDSRQKLKNDLPALLLMAGILCLTVVLIVETFRILLPGLWTVFQSGDERALGAYLNSQGWLRSFLTLWFLSFVQVVSLVIPAMPVQLAAGIAYGPWLGFLNSFSASVAANVLVFVLARHMARLIDTLAEEHPRLKTRLDSIRASKDPWFYTILAFLTPGLPNGVIPYAAAHANMKPKFFVAAVLISLPLPTFLTCAAGSFILSGDWTVSVLLEAGLFACVGLLFYNRVRIMAWAHAQRDKLRGKQ